MSPTLASRKREVEKVEIPPINWQLIGANGINMLISDFCSS
jgi:hypothetical protein